MKKVFVLAALALFVSCNSNEPNKVESMKTGSDTTSVMRDITSPYPIRYSSKFVMDDPKNAETLLTLWKDWDNGNLSAHKDMFADSVEMHFWNGSMLQAGRDSVLSAAQTARNTIASSSSDVDVIMAVKSTDKDENWAVIWGQEKDTDKKGKVDSFYLQEAWRFNKAGQANLVYQYRAAATPPKK
jgi:hypothetical protein